MYLVNVPVERWIIDPDVHGLLDDSCDVVHLPTYSAVVHPGMMICVVGMVIDGGRSLEMFLEPFPRSPCILSSVLLIIIHPVTLVPVDYSPFLSDGIPILGATRRFLMVLHPLKWIWTPSCHKYFEAFT